MIEDNALTLVDVGAAGGVADRWRRFKRLRTVGFEPFAEEFSKLEPSANSRWFPTALHERPGPAQLLIMGHATNISLLEPNWDLIESLCYDVSDFRVLRTAAVECETLDRVCAGQRIRPDALKLDTQGTELWVLRGAETVLRDSLFSVETEVEFLPLYKDQPLFTDVHAHLASRGFQLMDYGNVVHIKGRRTMGRGGVKSNMVAADALYFKSIAEVRRESEAGRGPALEAVVAVCAAYGYEDYAIELCLHLAETVPSARDEARLRLQQLSDPALSERIRQFLGDFHFSHELSLKCVRPLDRLLHAVKGAHWVGRLGNR